MSSPDGVPHIVPMKKLSNQHRCPDALSNVYTTLSFMNRTKEHVVVAYNYGVTQSVPPLPKPIHPYENENFVIRRTLTMSTIHAIRGMEAAIINMRNSCGTLNQENEYILKTILESLERDPRLSCLTVIFDFELTMEDLTENTVSYIPEVDLQVTMYGSVLKEYPHPRSREGVIIEDFRRQKTNLLQPGFSINVIDNASIQQVRFIFSAKRIIEIPSNKDITKEDGVYTTFVRPGRNGVLVAEVEFYTFEEAEKTIGLFPTRELAISNGNPEIINTQEEIKLRTSLRDLQHKQEMEKIEHERVVAQMKREVEMMKHELEMYRNVQQSEITKTSHKLEKKSKKSAVKLEKKSRKSKAEELDRSLEAARIKSHYEEQSLKRKDTSEFLKFLPLVFGAGFAVYGAIQASRKERNSGIT